MPVLPEEHVLETIEEKIAVYPDFPKPGILFRDIMPVLGDSNIFDQMIDLMCRKLSHFSFDRVLGIESRGFLLGPLIALKMKKPFSPMRKKGKLPGSLFSVTYDLEYGTDTLQVQKHGLPSDSRCVIVDDLIATGGSLEAAKKLIELSQSTTVAVAVIIELAALKGRDKLGETPMVKLFSY